MHTSVWYGAFDFGCERIDRVAEPVTRIINLGGSFPTIETAEHIIEQMAPLSESATGSLETVGIRPFHIHVVHTLRQAKLPVQIDYGSPALQRINGLLQDRKGLRSIKSGCRGANAIRARLH